MKLSFQTNEYILYFTKKVLAFIESANNDVLLANDLSRETLFIDAREDEDIYEPRADDLQTHRFLMYLKQNKICKIESINLKNAPRIYGGSRPNWYGITDRRYEKLFTNPPVFDTFAYLVNVKDVAGFKNLAKQILKRPNISKLNASNRVLHFRDNNLYFYKGIDAKLLPLSSPPKEILLATLILSDEESSSHSYASIATEANRILAKPAKLNASSVKRSFQQTIAKHFIETLSTINRPFSEIPNLCISSKTVTLYNPSIYKIKKP